MAKNALRDVVAESALEILLDDDKATNDGEMNRGQVADFVFAAARGAAEFAKRRQEGAGQMYSLSGLGKGKG